MTPEELLKPRFKVIANYPNSPFQIGDILPKALETDWVYLDEGMQKQTLLECEKYPALFKKLEWWEERAEKDLPQYLRLKGNIWKVDKWKENFIGKFTPSYKNEEGNDFLSIEWHFFKNEFLPATEEEYLKQLSTKKTEIDNDN